MATEIGKGVIPIGFDKAQISRDLSDAVLPALGRVAGDAALLGFGKKLFDFGKSGVEVLEQAQRITAQTEAQLRATGGAAGVTAKDIDGLSDSMRELAGFDDEAARSAANVLLRFSNIQGSDTFKRVEKDAADLAVTMGTDLPAAAQTLGQILQTPETAARKLRPIIGALSEAQQASVKAFVDQGNVAGAVGLILDDLEGKIGGTAAAFGDTLPGHIAKSRASMKEAKEDLVAGLAPALELSAAVANKFASGIDALPAPLQAAAGGTLLLGGGALALARPINDVVRLFDRFHTSAKAVAEAEDVLAVSQAAGATSAEASSAADLRRIVSNEALEFSDAQVTTAMQARQLAEIKQLVSNDALIVSEEELVAAQTTVEASGLGILAALGPLAIGAGIAAGAMLLFGNNEDGAAAASRSLETSNKQLGDSFSSLAEDGKTVDTTMRNYIDGLSRQDTVLPAFLGDTVDLNKTLAAMGATTGDVAAKLEQGGTAFGEFVIHARDAHQITNEQAGALLQFGQGIEDQAHKTLDADVAQGKLTASQVSGAVATNTAADGTINWVGVLTQLEGALALAVSNTNNLTRAEELNAAISKDAIATAQAGNQERQTRLDSTRNLFNAEQQFTSAERGVEQAEKNVAAAQRGVDDAQRRVEDSRRSLTDATDRLTDAETALAKAQQPASEEDLGKADLDRSNAHLRVADAQSAVTAAERAAADARKDGKHTAAEVADLDRKVEEAKNAVTAAVFAEQDAEEAYQKVQAKGTDQDEAVVAAKKAVDDATRGVEDANRQLTDSYSGVSDAQQRVTDAKDGINDALLTEAQASAGLKTAQDELFTGTHNATNEMYNEVSALDAIEGRLDPSSPLRKNLDSYLGDLGVLRDIFSMVPETGPNAVVGGNPNIPLRDSGGLVGPNQLFMNNTGGFEVALVPPGLNVGQPDVTSMILTDHQARATFAGTGSDRAKGKSLTVEPGGIVVHHTGPESTASAIAFELQIQADRMVAGIG